MTASREILGIVGSYRKGGNVDSIVQAILDSAESAGASTDKIYLSDIDIGFCTNCRECMQPPGEARVPCVVHDDGMEALLQRIEEAHGVVIGAPVNAGSVNALTQRFIERCVGFFFWPWGSHGGPRLRRKDKQGGAVLVSSSGAPALMNSLWFGVGAMHSLKTVAEVLGREVVDVVKVGMIAEPDVDLPQRTLAASRKAGERLLQYAAARD